MAGVQATLGALSRTSVLVFIGSVVAVAAIIVAIVALTGSDEAIIEHFRTNARHRP
jgi:ABC-type lipoprotein release transport system permease subunit